jgi:uncharacterized protein
MPGELVHFDIPAEDVDKMSAFYRNVMGWKIEPYGSEYGGYLMIDPAPDKDPEMAVKGGMGEKQMPEQSPMNYYRTDDLEKFNQRVKDNGGQVMMEKMPVAKMGYLSVCIDPEGNAFGGWLDDPDAA